MPDTDPPLAECGCFAPHLAPNNSDPKRQSAPEEVVGSCAGSQAGRESGQQPCKASTCEGGRMGGGWQVPLSSPFVPRLQAGT